MMFRLRTQLLGVLADGDIHGTYERQHFQAPALSRPPYRILQPLLQEYPLLPLTPDAFPVVDIKADYMNRLIIADQKGKIRIFQENIMEEIMLNIVGGFGKCFKLNTDRDKLYAIKENFELVVVDLSKEKFDAMEPIELSSDYNEVNMLSDWAIDFKNMIIYLLMNTGTISVFDYHANKKVSYRVEEKWFITLAKEDRNFTAMALSHNLQYLAISGVVTYKDKKSNSLFLYAIDRESKKDIKLTLASQISTENTWEGNKDYITCIDMSMTLNRQLLVACVTQCTANIYFFIYKDNKQLVLLQEPRKIHQRKREI